MQLFRPWYERALRWAAHRHAPWYLTGVSFIEAIFFPIPPEVMLAPMALAQPKRAYFFAAISLGGSMVGMFFGYALGYFALEWAMPLVEGLGYASEFAEIKKQAAENGLMLLIIAGFAPVPFKIFTIASGAVGMPLLPFFVGALIGRGKRVFLVAFFVRLFGERAEAALRRFIEPIGWAAMLLLVGVIGWLVLRAQGG